MSQHALPGRASGSRRCGAHAFVSCVYTEPAAAARCSSLGLGGMHAAALILYSRWLIPADSSPLILWTAGSSSLILWTAARVLVQDAVARMHNMHEQQGYKRTSDSIGGLGDGRSLEVSLRSRSIARVLETQRNKCSSDDLSAVWDATSMAHTAQARCPTA